MTTTVQGKCVKKLLEMMIGAVCVVWPVIGAIAGETIEFGEIQDNKYTNDFFGMSMRIPASWNVIDNQQQKRLMESGTKLLAGNDAKLKQKFDLAKLRTVRLFMISKYPLKARVAVNPYIIAVAENLNGVGDLTPEQYLSILKRQLMNGKFNARFPGKIEPVKIGGKDFRKLDSILFFGKMPVWQTYYAAIIKDYILGITVSYDKKITPEQQQILDSIKFE
jgi:hypothetical protein